MSRSTSLPAILLISLLVLRPHFSGAAYPFMQGILLPAGLIGLALLFLVPKEEKIPSIGRVGGALVLPWVLCGWSFLSILWSADQGRGTAISFALLLNVTVFTQVFLLIRRGYMQKGWWALALCFLLIPVLGRALYQHFIGISRLRDLLLEMEAGGWNTSDLLGVIAKGRVFAAFLNSNMLAGFLAVLIPLTLDLALTAAGRGRQFLFSFLTAAQFGVLVLTGSMGGSLAASAAAVAVFLFRKGLRRRELFWMAGIGVFLIAGLVIVRGIPMWIGPDNSILQRAGYMKAGLLMAGQRPFFGWGAGSTPGALMGYVAPGIRPVADPHNFLVRSWIEWGFPGIAILASFLFLWAKKVLVPAAEKGWRFMPGGYVGLFVGSLAFLLHSLMDMDFFVPETALFGWVAMGGSLGMAARAEKSHGIVGEELSGKRVRWSAAGTALALVIPSLIFSQGEFTAFKGYRAMENGQFEEAARLYRDAGRLLPFNGRFTLEEGRVKKALGEKEEAKALFSKASRQLRFSPYPLWEMGRLALAEEDWEGSIPHLEKALQRYPTSPRIHLDLAQAYLRLGDYDTTIRLLEEVKRWAVFDPEAMRFAQKALERPEEPENTDSGMEDDPIQAH